MEEYIIKDGKQPAPRLYDRLLRRRGGKGRAAYMLLTGRREAPTVDLLTPKGILP